MWNISDNLQAKKSRKLKKIQLLNLTTYLWKPPLLERSHVDRIRLRDGNFNHTKISFKKVFFQWYIKTNLKERTKSSVPSWKINGKNSQYIVLE